MSKESAVRAMREARYAERMKRAAGGTTTPSAAARTKAHPPVAPPVVKTAAAATDGAVTDELCGHKSMNGRTCTREKGHAAKNHRYS
jgi:hypothetical protein